VRVVFFPDVQVYKDNLYWELLKEGLEQKGVEFFPSDHRIYLTRGWLLGHRSQVDVIHLHHIEPQYAAKRLLPSANRLARYAGKLLLARLLGYRIVWTVHNLFPHEQPRPSSFDHLANFFTAQLANAVIVHCSFARDFIGKVYLRRRNVFTLEHPNYIRAYPNTTFKKEARKWLGLCDQQKVLLYFGAVRPYKGIEQLVEVFRSIQRDELALIIAGKPWTQKLATSLVTLSETDRRIRLVLEFIPDESLQHYFNAADMVVLPYTDTLSSGSAMLAMSFGRPVVAPALGCLSEVITEDSGILYDPTDPDGLYKALIHALSIDLESMGQKAAERVQLFTWEKMVCITQQIYHDPGHVKTEGLRLKGEKILSN